MLSDRVSEDDLRNKHLKEFAQLMMGTQYLEKKEKE
jgi:hypothetical protein